MHHFSPHFLLTHQMGCLAICLLRVRKHEIVTADGKMGKSDHDSNRENEVSNRSNEEQSESEKTKRYKSDLREEKGRKKRGKTTDLESREKKSRL